MILANLWRRKGRTILTLIGISTGIAAIVAQGSGEMFTAMWRVSKTDLLAIEGGVDADLSAIDERVGAQIEARPEVEAVSGTIMTAVSTEQVAMLLVFGYHPRSFGDPPFPDRRGRTAFRSAPGDRRQAGGCADGPARGRYAAPVAEQLPSRRDL
jgi:hypothetical protein